ncbi:MAG: Crp/Fnr family transcriptional regulator [Pseudomonadota bacterium]
MLYQSELRNRDATIVRSNRALDRCADCPARRDGLCAHIPASVLAEFSTHGAHYQFRRGETYIWEGEPNMTVGQVLTGAFRFVITSPDGQERTVGLALPGDFIGDPFGGVAVASLVALGAASVCAIDQSRIDTIIRQSPETGRALLRRTIGDLDRARRWILLLGCRSATKRVATLLCELAARHSGGADSRIDLPFSRSEMADVLGLTIETVSRKLHALVRGGGIALPDTKGFIVRDTEALHRAAS